MIPLHASLRALLALMACFILLPSLSGCNAADRDIVYEYQIGEGSEAASVLFVYPHKNGELGCLIADGPAMFFAFLETTMRFRYRFIGADASEDALYLECDANLYMVTYAGPSEIEPGWHIYHVYRAAITILRHPANSWRIPIAIFVFPLHLLRDADGVIADFFIDEEDNVLSLDFDLVMQFYADVDVGVIDAEARTVSTFLPDYANRTIVIADNGDDTIIITIMEE